MVKKKDIQTDEDYENWYDERRNQKLMNEFFGEQGTEQEEVF